MADVKISELPALTSPDGAEELVVNDGGTTKKITIANATSAALPKAGGTMTGDTLHGDNVKAKFGTGNDLEIYSDGTNSRITELGSGSLIIKGTQMLFQTAAGENSAYFTSDGSVRLYHNNVSKFETTSTGIDVTGDVTADGLTLGDNEKAKFGASGDLQIYHSGATSWIRDLGTGDLVIDTDGGNIALKGAGPTSTMARFFKGGSVDLYHDGNEKLATTSTGVDVTGTITADGLTVANSGNGDVYVSRNSGASVHLQAQSAIGKIGTSSNHKLGIMTNGSTRLTVDTNGKVGINNSAPAYPLHVTGEAGIELYNATGGGDVINLRPSLGDANKFNMSISSYDHSGNGVGPSDGISINAYDGVSIATGSGTARQERMRIDSAGTMLIQTGGAAPSSSQEGISLGLSGPDGAKIIVANTLTSTFAGAIVFINGNGQVGTISTSGSATSYNTSSDYRLKTDVQPMTGATATFMQLKPCNFEWIADGTRVDGFLAHELGEVIPAAATGTHNGMMDEEYQATAATGDIYTAAIAEVATESQVMETVETGSYVNLAGETIVETTEQGVTTDLVETVVQRQDVDGVSTEVEVEVTTKVPTMETVITIPAVAEVIHSADVEHPETLEDGQAWRETTAQVMATRSVPDMQGIDQAKVVPLLVATLQEALARIEALEA